MHYLGLLYGKVDVTLAEIIFLIVVNFGGIELAMVQAVVLVKALLIFKGEWLADRTDSEVIWFSRIFVMLYSGFRFLVDFSQPPKTFHTLTLLTSTDVKS